jgi:hypothetical protein
MPCPYIDATDCEIVRRVYDLYGLTEEEIRIVEGKAVASEPTASVSNSLTRSGPATEVGR